MIPVKYRLLLLTLLLCLNLVAHAQENSCQQITDDQLRLQCYDKQQKLTGLASENKPLLNSSGNLNKNNQTVSLLTERWELDSDPGQFIFRPYKPVYFFPIFYSSDTNLLPHTPTHESPPSELPIDNVETKFQLSFKTKLAKSLLGDDGDLWLGYTQSSHWQLYNGENSRPFRETNHEPELIFSLRQNYELMGYTGKMLSLSLNHQSNGRADILSRSWNRVILTVGLDRPDWAVMFRPWWRLPEKRSDDDNPDIEDYLGRGELLIVHRKHNSHQISARIRHSLRSSDDSRGSVKLDYSYPCFDRLRCHAQIFSGYGESMIDYNHRTTTLGLGIALLEWF
jgi:phospholipase A1/A2